jgi:hypothetical protein
MIGDSIMKVLKSSSLVLVLPLILGFSGQPQAQAQTSNSQKIVAAMIEALGGAAFLEVREIQTQGSFYSFSRGELQGYGVYTDYMKLPDRGRLELVTNRDKTIQINRGNEGWVLTGRDGRDVKPQSARETEEFLIQMKTNFDYITRFVLTAPKASPLVTGTEIVEFRRTDIVEIRDEQKNLFRYFVDRDTRLPVKTQVRRTGEAILHEESYANWHKFQGVATPLFVTRYRDGMKIMEIRAEKVAYNPGFAETLFSPPAAR